MYFKIKKKKLNSLTTKPEKKHKPGAQEFKNICKIHIIYIL